MEKTLRTKLWINKNIWSTKITALPQCIQKHVTNATVATTAATTTTPNSASTDASVTTIAIANRWHWSWSLLGNMRHMHVFAAAKAVSRALLAARIKANLFSNEIDLWRCVAYCYYNINVHKIKATLTWLLWAADQGLNWSVCTQPHAHFSRHAPALK